MNEFSSAPSEIQFPYAGWVPTANGRLSFRHVGEAEYPTKSIYANVAAASVRLLLAYQARPFGDVLFPAIHNLFGITGKFWFALAAESNSVPNNSDTLSGRIFIFKSKEDWRSNGEPAIREPIHTINKQVRFLDPTKKEEGLKKQYTAAYDALSRQCDALADFQLMRTGEVFLSTPVFRDIDLRDGSSEIAEAIGHSFEKSIADQAYFFLRDLCHRHQHHNASEDTILILQTRTADDTEWRKFILYSLQYQIIKAKRGSAPLSAYQALGILAYCSSFRRICEMRKSWGEIGNLPTFNEDTLRESVCAQADYANAHQVRQDAISASRLSRSANTRAFALGALAIVLALLGVLIQPQINLRKSAELDQLSVYVVRNLSNISGFIALTFGLVWIGSGDLFRFQIWRDVLEAANVKRRGNLALFAFVGLIFVSAALYFGQSALSAIFTPIAVIWSALTSSVPADPQM